MEKLVAGAARLGIELTPTQIEQFQTYYQALVAWNQRVNLTAITDYAEVQVKHFLDSLSVTLAQRPLPAPLLDVGTGAGFPGLPLKIAYPELSVILLESTGKKAAFLHHLVPLLGLDGVDIISARAEEGAHDPALRERFATVVARALAPMPALLELTLPFCSVGGMLVSQKKGEIGAELDRSKRALELLGGRLREVVDVPLEGLEDRVLVVVDKVTPTPAQYPRRVGGPTHRPLV